MSNITLDFVDPGSSCSFPSFFPFLAGDHICLGKRLAEVELAVAVIILLKSFHFDNYVGKLEENFRISLYPKNLELKVSRRV